MPATLLAKVKNKLSRWRTDAALSQMMARVAADNEAFDRRYSVDTATAVQLDEYGMDAAAVRGAGHYQGVHEGVLSAIIRNLAPDPSGWEFLDVGSGKGKALLVAAKFPFARVRGIELAPKLHETAAANISRFRASGDAKCADVASLCMDARQVSGLAPATLIFLFNPFDDEALMGDVVRRIEAEAGGRNLLLAYLVPALRGPLDRSAVFKLLLDTRRLAIYGCGDVAISDQARAALSVAFNSWSVG